MSSWMVQGFRFGVVGLASNAVLFVFYLILTSIGIGPKIAMSCMFLVGTLQTFLFNKRWTFGHNGASKRALVKYFVVYSGAYAVNLLALLVLVDQLGYAHQVVQGLMILFLAVFIFLLQKFWVFGVSPSSRSMRL
ncbi:MAG: GtrA family protein [Desulfuromonadales bacterium]|nr:GtrA family protein [Desulfuromonadales bacterium]